MAAAPLVGAVEGGGTKFVCGAGTGPGDIETATIPTTTPDETLDACLSFFRDFGQPLEAIGIGSFGPVDVKPDSPAFGSITTTPKKGWAGTAVAPFFKDSLGIPVAFDTDVNAAAIGEGKWGAARGLNCFVYFTIGTGIGAGVVIDGNPVHGLTHPEIGHLRIPRDPARDPFEGSCPFHGDCFEGLAAGPAIAARWKCDPKSLAPDHEAWNLEAEYIALAVMNVVLTVSPQRVILGGGVMEQGQLFPMIRERLKEQLHGYLGVPEVGENVGQFIVPPENKNRAGILGALAMAQAALA